MAKTKDPKDFSDADLITALTETKEELFNLRFQHATGQLDNYARLTQAKREVARVKTEVRAREIAAAEAMEAQA